MIDFSALQGLTIPEGVVTQITDAAGNVLWSAKPSVVTITITGEDVGYAWVEIAGTELVAPTTVEVPVGTVITCGTCSDDDCEENIGGCIYVNGARIPNEDAVTDLEYYYTVTANTQIFVCEKYEEVAAYGYIEITETYAVSINQAENGTLATSNTAGAGTTVTLTATPADGYAYGGATVTYADGTTYATLDADTLTFTMPAADVIVTPVWSEVETIKFTIAGTTYKAVEGMTWGEWVVSAYNTGNYYLSANNILISSSTGVGYNGMAVVSHVVIVSGRAYVHIMVAGGGGS